MLKGAATSSKLAPTVFPAAAHYEADVAVAEMTEDSDGTALKVKPIRLCKISRRMETHVTLLM
jgi:hypothetical protein